MTGIFGDFADFILKQLANAGVKIDNPNKLRWIAETLFQESIDAQPDGGPVPHFRDVLSKYLEMQGTDEWIPDQRNEMTFDEKREKYTHWSSDIERQVEELMFAYGIEPRGVVRGEALLIGALINRFGFKKLFPPPPRGRRIKRKEPVLEEQVSRAKAGLEQESRPAGPQVIAIRLLSDPGFREKFHFRAGDPYEIDRLRKRIKTILDRKKNRPVYSP